MKGHDKGMVLVGMFHENGWLGDANIDEAIKWYEKAAALENPEALQAMSRLRK